ncbi:MAG: acyl carrier protein [Gammaproteobacteria bacterium]
MEETTQIAARLLGHIRSDLLEIGESFSLDSDLFAAGLDSMSIMQLILFIEEEFGDQPIAKGDAVGRRRAAGGPPNVIVSGWQVYDNKGRVVEKYEPFFAVGRDYVAPGDAQSGQKATMFHDPRGQVIRTLHPDGSEQRVIYGIPADLTNPEQFAPTPIPMMRTISRH